MERELLLLGLLRLHDMHGYQLNEFLDAHLGTSVQLKKPTVYKLLGGMVDEGWIEYHEEQEGNYPVRRVYRITAEGEAAFQDLLRHALAAYRPGSPLSGIGFMYLDALPAGEAVALLQDRRQAVERMVNEVETIEDHPEDFRTVLSYHLHCFRAELEWIDSLTSRLRQAGASGSQAARAGHELEVLRDE